MFNLIGSPGETTPQMNLLDILMMSKIHPAKNMFGEKTEKEYQTEIEKLQKKIEKYKTATVSDPLVDDNLFSNKSTSSLLPPPPPPLTNNNQGPPAVPPRQPQNNNQGPPAVPPRQPQNNNQGPPSVHGTPPPSVHGTPPPSVHGTPPPSPPSSIHGTPPPSLHGTPPPSPPSSIHETPPPSPPSSVHGTRSNTSTSSISLDLSISTNPNPSLNSTASSQSINKTKEHNVFAEALKKIKLEQEAKKKKAKQDALDKANKAAADAKAKQDALDKANKAAADAKAKQDALDKANKAAADAKAKQDALDKANKAAADAKAKQDALDKAKGKPTGNKLGIQNYDFTQIDSTYTKFFNKQEIQNLVHLISHIEAKCGIKPSTHKDIIDKFDLQHINSRKDLYDLIANYLKNFNNHVINNKPQSFINFANFKNIIVPNSNKIEHLYGYHPLGNGSINAHTPMLANLCDHDVVLYAHLGNFNTYSPYFAHYGFKDNIKFDKTMTYALLEYNATNGGNSGIPDSITSFNNILHKFVTQLYNASSQPYLDKLVTTVPDPNFVKIAKDISDIELNLKEYDLLYSFANYKKNKSAAEIDALTNALTNLNKYPVMLKLKKVTGNNESVVISNLKEILKNKNLFLPVYDVIPAKQPLEAANFSKIIGVLELIYKTTSLYKDLSEFNKPITSPAQLAAVVKNYKEFVNLYNKIKNKYTFIKKDFDKGAIFKLNFPNIDNMQNSIAPINPPVIVPSDLISNLVSLKSDLRNMVETFYTADIDTLIHKVISQQVQDYLETLLDHKEYLKLANLTGGTLSGGSGQKIKINKTKDFLFSGGANSYSNIIFPFYKKIKNTIRGIF